MDPKKKILEQRGREVVKAGSLFASWLLEGEDELLEKLRAEEEDSSDNGALTVEGYEVEERSAPRRR